ncbi:MAG: hypothetical protein B0D92_08020 [Spirochaeta sp. LUC14_002_19_P3]|nr:MAG: hypothetical protein B0D92_08020 [Spirochaeta sp. LUC14_002_19_P3]
MKEKVGTEAIPLENSLPELPIPSLEQTCRKYPEWVQPLLNEEEWEQTRRITEEFGKKEGPILQKALQEWGADRENWLEEFWYRTYLDSRSPVPVNSNPFFWQENQPRTVIRSQTEQTARIIQAASSFKILINSGELSADMDRNQPLCMNQYQRMFSTTRIPGHGTDTLRSPADSTAPSTAGHVVVLCRGVLFRCDALTDTGALRSLADLQADIEEIRRRAEGGNSPAQGIGVLTSLPREEWAEAREALILNPANLRALDVIETALFTLSLDDAQPADRDELAMQLLSGSGENRWFDKALQFIVLPDGGYGVNMEHTGLDATPVLRLGKTIEEWSDDEGNAVSASPGNIAEIPFMLTEEIGQNIQKAKADYESLVRDTHIRTVPFCSFGSEKIKSLEISPDAFVQLAMLLASYRTFGTFKNLYEAVMTRGFRHGRTEAMRPLSCEAARFVLSMVSGSGEAAALRKAAELHTQRLKECRAGEGIARHLYGLNKMFQLKGPQLGIHSPPPLFTDSGWQRIQNDTLSASTVGAARGFTLGGFGPVSPDGFGIRYASGSTGISFTLSCRAAMREALGRFTAELFKALNEMEALLRSTLSV